MNKIRVLETLNSLKNSHWSAARRYRDQVDRATDTIQIEKFTRRVRQEMRCVDELNAIIDWVRERKQPKANDETS